MSDYDSYRITPTSVSAGPEIENEIVKIPGSSATLQTVDTVDIGDAAGTSFPANFVYDSYAGVDIVVDLVLPGDEPVYLGELQTFSYSLHRENQPVRTVGHVMPISFGKGSRTIAGSMIFTVFNAYAFYRLGHFRRALDYGLHPVVDMLPPFDINITFVNEYGAFSKLRVLGVTIVDEGGTMSVDDLIQEATFSYMARGIQPLTAHRLEDESDASEAIRQMEARRFNG